MISFHIEYSYTELFSLYEGELVGSNNLSGRKQQELIFHRHFDQIYVSLL